MMLFIQRATLLAILLTVIVVGPGSVRGDELTTPQDVVNFCTSKYDAIESLKFTATASSDAKTFTTDDQDSATSKVEFKRPDMLRVDGLHGQYDKFAVVCNSGQAEDYLQLKWHKEFSPNGAVFIMGAVSLNTATTVPALLMHLRDVQVFESDKLTKNVGHDTIGGRKAYRIAVAENTMELRIYWIDEKSGLLVKEEDDWTMGTMGKRVMTCSYNYVSVNGSIPDSVFAMPN